MKGTPSPLVRLCTRLGIATSYDDFWGERREVPEAALRRCAAAMGMPAADTPEALARLTELDRRAAACVLPPVHVMRQAAPKPLRLNGHAARGYTLVLEDGTERDGAIDGEGRLQLPDPLPLGYHRLTVPEAGAATLLVVCPERCHTPAAFADGARWWGPALQVYALRSARQWGMGDFTDLRHVVDLAAGQGAGFVGVNPMHALYPHDPERASPYGPSSRSGLDPLYLDVEAVPGFRACEAARALVDQPEFQGRLQRLRERSHIDRTGVAAAKFEVLRALHAHFHAVERARDPSRALAFDHFREVHASWLRPLTLFNAWRALRPDPLPPIDAPRVEAFAEREVAEIDFHAWLQWEADRQLGEVGAHARAMGLPLGLYRDLAVGVSDDSAEVWARPALHARGMSAGAPDEAANPSGQSWGLSPPLPERWADEAYEPFAAMLRANMRHAGALRIDHAMALQRLFWVPADADARSGTYVAHPFEDLLNVLVLESVRHRCVVIGEALGNVPEGFREALAARGVLSYGPMYFAATPEGTLPPPRDWSAESLAVVGTHDLPTLPAWWLGEDIALRRALGLYPDPARHHEQVVARAQERARLLLALEDEGLVEPGTSLRPPAEAGPALVEAVHAYMGRTAARLVGVQFEDVTGQHEPVNVPGTSEAQRPNWRVRMAVDLDTLATDPRWLAVAAALRAGRSSAAARPAAWPALSTAPVPRATYRIQFHAGMRFEQATAIVPYLEALGVSHLYASPYLKARPGSQHGYDVVDPNALNPEIGTPADHDRLCAALRERGLSQVLDIVPNHMGVLEAGNDWWLDVLECGEASPHAATFDIEWHPADPVLHGRLLLPVLGDPYGEVLESGTFRLGFDAEAGTLSLHYHGHRFPLDPATYPDVFDASPLPDDPGEGGAAMRSLLDAFRHLPPRDTDAAGRATRQRDKRALQRRLAALCAGHAWVREWLDRAIGVLHGTPGDPVSFDRLDALVAKQAWRPAFWRVSGDEVNYRRFFDIDTLAAVRMERPEVFDAAHRLVMRWVGEGRIEGLRIDHPDGLRDPRGYFEQLQARHERERRERGQPARALFVAVEKILAEHEQIPDDWPVHGGTGYRFSNQVNGLFVDARHEKAFDRLLRTFTGRTDDVDLLLREAKGLVMTTSLASDLEWLTGALHRIASADRRTRDFTRGRLRFALTEVARAFPVYRTYIDEHGASAQDRQHVAWAVAEARRHATAADQRGILFLRDVLLTPPGTLAPERREALLAFIARWQQFTAPVMAKSMEDTVFYQYHRLVSLNDVGGDPRRFGMSVAAFHAANAARARHLPHTLLATSTHDSKRSEDVRARLNVLSEVPASWARAVRCWAAMNRPRAERHDARIDPGDEYLLYQTLVGVWPFAPVGAAALASLEERVQAYLLKAVREAKRFTSWVNPDAAYESALARFVHLLLGVQEPNPFVRDLEAWLPPVSRAGCWNSLNQVLLKFTSPGVPDLYQGSELWNFSLVDPDNRRPVDFVAREAALADVMASYRDGRLDRDALRALREDLPSGRLKLLLTARLLGLRKARPGVFAEGTYVPLEVSGPAADHVIAFARVHGDDAVVVIATRLLATLGDDGALAWHGTEVALPTGIGDTWQDGLTGAPVTTPGARVPLDTVLPVVPFAVLFIGRDA